MNHLLFYVKENQTPLNYSSLNFFIFLSNFQISKYFISLFSGTERPAKLKLGPHMDSRLMYHVGRVKRIWYLSPMRAAKVQASLRIRAVSPEPQLLAYTSSESRGTFRQKARSLAPLNGWACAVKICHDGMLEDTNSVDGAHVYLNQAAGAYLFLQFSFSQTH